MSKLQSSPDSTHAQKGTPISGCLNGTEKRESLKKYELTSEQHPAYSKLFRIRSLKKFGIVAIGELGGFIETENNLSQEGKAWVSGDARVSEFAVSNFELIDSEEGGTK